MSTTRERGRARGPEHRAGAGLPGTDRFHRVLVAVDGSSEPGDAAIDTAAALIEAHGSTANVVSVVDPFTAAALAVGLQGAVAGAPTLRALQSRRRAAIRRRLAERAHPAAPWAVHVALGTPGDIIVDSAQASGADLVVVGLRRHGALDRIAHDETTLHVARHATVPVLAVTPGLHGMPRVVVVAVDFGGPCAAAAATACALFSGSAKLVLAHVESQFDTAMAAHDEATRIIREEGLAAAFRRLRESLTVPGGATVTSARLRGDPAEALAAFVQRSGADVLVLARKRHSLAERLIGGILTTTLVRQAPCSLLITPSEAVQQAEPLPLQAAEPSRARSRGSARRHGARPGAGGGRR